LPKVLLLGILQEHKEAVGKIVKGARKRQRKVDKQEAKRRFKSETDQPGFLALVKKNFLAYFVRKRIKQEIESERDAEAFEFHLSQIDGMDQARHSQNIKKHEQMGAIKGFVYFHYIMDHDEQIEIISDATNGRKRYIIAAWFVSIVWTAWCNFYVLLWLMRLNDPGMDENGNPLPASVAPLDWVWAFCIGSVMDFVILTPGNIMLSVVLLPFFIVWASKAQTSASYGGDASKLDIRVSMRVDKLLREEDPLALQVVKIDDLEKTMATDNDLSGDGSDWSFTPRSPSARETLKTFVDRCLQSLPQTSKLISFLR
jgi:hypothetical protein